MRPFVALLAALAIAPVFVDARTAGVVHISPTTVTVGAGESTASFIVRNEGKTPLSFAVTAFGWRSTATNDMQLDKTDDLIVYPQRLEVAAGETRRVRVGTRVAADRIERSYRISLEQVSEPDPVPGAVSMRMRYSLPLFVQPKVRKATVRLDGLAIDATGVKMTLANIGVVHVTPKRLSATGTDASGKIVWTKEISAWYLLPGDSRVYRQTLTSDECRRTRSVAAEATFLEGTGLSVRSTQVTGPGACARP